MSNDLAQVQGDSVIIPAAVLEEIGRHLIRQRNFDIGSYKDAYIRRRIGMRVGSTSSPSAEAYLGLLLHNDDELDRLLKTLKIHVSHFFRDPSTFDKMRSHILPLLIASRKHGGADPLTIWSVGCAGGEEPYSVAMMIHRDFPEEWEAGRVRIEGTDVDADIIEEAKKGAYRPEQLADVPQELKDRYFSRIGGTCHLSPEITRMVTFRRSDLSAPDQFVPSDLILCRNVLIYFERWQQLRITEGFAQHLRPGGFLVLGRAETLLPEIRKSFEAVYPADRSYRRL